jgi:5-(carboxyamino)imidazole ribonucleotide synthase
MAMECFRVGDQLMINELAPRVHNSGHWTQAGASISQFEYHLRAVADMAIPKAQILGLNVMINLIGTEYNAKWLSLPVAQTYWYGKAVLPGRKVGHINLVSKDAQDLRATLQELKQLLPEQYYKEAIAWSLNALE